MIQKPIVCVLVLLLLTISLLSMFSTTSNCAADINDVEKRRVEYNQYFSYHYSALHSGDHVQITVEVTDGGNIDVYYMSSFEFVNYEYNRDYGTGEFNVIYEKLASKLFSIDLVVSEDADYVLVIDNTYNPDDGADPTDYVDVTITSNVVNTEYSVLEQENKDLKAENDSNAKLIIGICIGFFIACIICPIALYIAHNQHYIAIDLDPNKKKKKTEQPMKKAKKKEAQEIKTPKKKMKPKRD
jgi:hypothetical protein